MRYFPYLTPCKIGTRILAGSRWDSVGTFYPPGFLFPAGFWQDSRRKAKFLVTKILPGSSRESRQDSRWEAKIPAAKISPGSCRESRRKANFLPARSCRESRRVSRLESKFCRNHCGNFRRVLDMLQRIPFGAILFQIKV